jgi:hypothetical protein
MVPLVDPAPTVTLAGTVTLAFPLLSETARPPAGAAPLNETVQVALPGAFTVAGLQLSPLSTVGAVTLMIPDIPAGETVMEVPEGSEMVIPEIAIGRDGPTVLEESWKEATATTPSAIAV